MQRLLERFGNSRCADVRDRVIGLVSLAYFDTNHDYPKSILP